MEQPPPSPQPPSSSTPQPTEHQQHPPLSSLPLPSSSAPPTPTPSSNPNPNPTPPTPQPPPSLQNSQTRPPFSRPWQQQTPHFSSHLSSMSPSPQSPSSSSSTSPSTPPVPPFSSSASSTMPPPPQRGGMAIGVPAHHPTPPQPSTSFSPMNPPPSFGQQFGGLSRNSVNVLDSSPNSSTSQGIGMTGSLGSPMRPVGVPVHHQQLRSIQSSLRPQPTLNNQSPSTHNFQGQTLLRVLPGGSSASPSPSTSQSTPSHNQPWLSSGSQGKPPLPCRPQMNPQTLLQRSHVPQQHHQPSMPPPPPPQQQQQQQQQQQTSSASQSQPSISHQPQEHFGQQFPPPRIQSLSSQQPRSQGLAQKPMAQPMVAQPSSGVQPGPVNRAAASGEPGESSTRILSKRSIQELVTQIDPMERLDPEVEDILMDIADEFVESITTFGCSLAKHRKSTTLEAKDILLHLERNWNMTLPGFGGDEIKSYKKPAGSDIHRERLAVIKKSVVASEMSNAKSSTGQAGGNSKGHVSKPPASIIGSPNPKIREPV